MKNLDKIAETSDKKNRTNPKVEDQWLSNAVTPSILKEAAIRIKNSDEMIGMNQERYFSISPNIA